MKILNVTLLSEMCEFLLEGEPCFVIRAQDKAAVDSVAQYIELATKLKGRNTIRAAEHLKRMIQWQQDNPKKLKTPD